VAPAFSCTEITDAIYHGLMRREPDGSFHDVFLMSKGHGCMIQYVILEELGILTARGSRPLLQTGRPPGCASRFRHAGHRRFPTGFLGPWARHRHRPSLRGEDEGIRRPGLFACSPMANSRRAPTWESDDDGGEI